MKLKRTILSLLLAAVAVRAVAAGAGGGTNSNAPAKPLGLADLLTDTVVARGKGFEIKRSQLDQAMVNARSQLAASGQKVQPGQLAMLEQQALDSLILVELLNAKATPEEKARAREESNKDFEQFKKSFPDEKTMADQLAAMGMSMDKFRADLNKQMVANVLLRAKAAVPDADVKKYYEDNPSMFERPERVRASHILIMTINPNDGSPLPDDQKPAKRKQIDDLRKRAVAGEDFAMLATQYSEDTGAKDKGGEYTFGRGQMDPAFEAAAFALKTNEISDVVTSRYGYHIIKLSERYPAGKASFDEASAFIRKRLETQAIQKFIPQYYVELKKNANVEILDEKLKAMEDSAAAKTPAEPPAPGGK